MLSKLFNLISSICLIGGLLCYAALNIPLQAYISTANAFFPLFIGGAIVSAVVSLFLKAVWRIFTLIVLAVLLFFGYHWLTRF